ncbi:RecQ family ATP-dependent DNA helicase [Ectobacillus polymachus]|uniref:RecQ family ATP-dependent DNA helicase n=1 Tax=Ectobacillus polymachus TaxID=1508806 RepID=UPI003A8625E1
MNIEAVLKEKFKYESFRPGQREIIMDLLDGHNVVAMLPTGGGKSITYQIPAFVREGAVVIVSPLLSLMEDQVDQLRLIGEKRVIAFNSFRTYEEKQKAMQNIQTYKFIFVSPEMLQSRIFVRAMKRTNISLFVVDEAHCISQWGYDFRPDYQRLHNVITELDSPPVLALTATATREMLDDIVNTLQLKDVKLHLFSIDRPNIAFCVERVDSTEEKKRVLLDYVKRLEGPGIIYCSSRYWSEAIALYLRDEGVMGVSHYHGGMDQEDRMLIQQQFIHDQLRIISCTSAFGMGINKPNVRYVIHFQYPSNIESYLQEIGRAGRDQQDSVAIVLLSAADHEVPISMISSELPQTELIEGFVSTLVQERTSMISLERTEEVARNIIGFTEQHWRFVYFQLESLGIIEGEWLDKEKLGLAAASSISEAAATLLQQKMNKLRAMQRWLSTNECRRLGLLQLFGYRLDHHPDHCCDLCGIDVNYYCKSNNKEEKEQKDWRMHLGQLFYLNMWREHE